MQWVFFNLTKKRDCMKSCIYFHIFLPYLTFSVSSNFHSCLHKYLFNIRIWDVEVVEGMVWKNLGKMQIFLSFFIWLTNEFQILNLSYLILSWKSHQISLYLSSEVMRTQTLLNYTIILLTLPSKLSRKLQITLVFRASSFFWYLISK